MEMRKLGWSGIEVSVVGLGCNNFGGRMGLDATHRVVHKALDLGINFFDTADVYGNRGGSEDFLGRALGERRKDIVLATKFGLPMDEAGRLKGASRSYIIGAVEASLARLRTDWIDLYQLHRPDPFTPIEETLRALDDLVRQGKIRLIGCSNLDAAAVVEAQSTADRLGLARFVTCQDEYSLLARDIEQNLMPEMRANGLALLPYFPLASGFLTGKYRRDKPLPPGARLSGNTARSDQFINERNWAIVAELDRFAIGRGRTMLELAFSWLLASPLVASVIAGATTAEQLEQNVRAAGWRMTADALAEIDHISAR